MKKILIGLFIVAFLLAYLLTLTFPAHAQSITSGHIVYTTRPMKSELRDFLDAWLLVSPPYPSEYWIVTYTQDTGLEYFVSLVGMNYYDVDRRWNLENNSFTWIGTVTVDYQGVVSLYSDNPISHISTRHLASPSFSGPGGGSDISLPWQSGKTMMYGPRAIHGEGDYGTSGMFAVDWVGGNDLGSGVASDDVYASADGEVDYICEDGTSVAVRLHGDDNYFLYAHLDSNDNLTMGHTFQKRDNIGSLVHGTFEDDCGWAEQEENHYHLHWMFVPDDGFFRAENCILDFSTTKWTCGSTEYGTGEYVRNGGTGNGNGDDDPQTTNEDVSFFDFLVAGITGIFEVSFIKLLPSHESFEYTQTLMNTIGLLLRITRVLVYGNINLGPLISVIIAGIGFRLLFGAMWLTALFLKVIKTIVPFT